MQSNALRKTTPATDTHTDGSKINYYHSGKRSQSPHSCFLQITLQCLTMQQQSNASKGAENKAADIVLPLHKSMVGLHHVNSTQLPLLLAPRGLNSPKRRHSINKGSPIWREQRLGQREGVKGEQSRLQALAEKWKSIFI